MMVIVYFIAIITTWYWLSMAYMDFINAYNKAPYNEKEVMTEGKVKLLIITIASIAWAIILS